MSYDVRTVNSVEYSSIKFGKTYKYGNTNNLINIYYGTNKEKLIIQTPLMYMPNSIIKFNNKPFIELSFNNESNDNEILEFKNWILELENYIYKSIKRRIQLKITKEKLNSIIKNGYNGNSVKLLVPLSLSISKCILENKFLFNWDIPVPTYGISVIWIKNIWSNGNKWGLNLFMYASRVMNSHILDPKNFMGDSVTTIVDKFNTNDKMTTLIGQVPEYITYFKMLKLGIPKDAIKQKMTLNNIDCKIIDFSELTPYITVLHNISQQSQPQPQPQPQLLHQSLHQSLHQPQPQPQPLHQSLPQPQPQPLHQSLHQLLHQPQPQPQPQPLHQSLQQSLLQQSLLRLTGLTSVIKSQPYKYQLTKSNAHDSVINEIKDGNFKLKKVIIENKTLLFGTNLIDIQTALNKLKKINFDDN